jgi:hypothetical protein
MSTPKQEFITEVYRRIGKSDEVRASLAFTMHLYFNVSFDEIIEEIIIPDCQPVKRYIDKIRLIGNKYFLCISDIKDIKEFIFDDEPLLLTQSKDGKKLRRILFLFKSHEVIFQSEIGANCVLLSTFELLKMEGMMKTYEDFYYFKKIIAQEY